MLFEPVVCFFWESAWPAGTVEPMRRLYETELVYLSKGSFDLEIAGQITTMQPGMVALIPPGVWHESRCGRQSGVMRHCIHFEWQPGVPRPDWQIQSFVGEAFEERLVSPVPPAIAGRLPLIVTLSTGDEPRLILDLALNRLRGNSPTGARLLWPVLQLLLDPPMYRTASGRKAPPPQSGNDAAAIRVRDYIDLNYHRTHGYDTYTELTGLSASHLCQAFKRRFGRTPVAYLSDLRLSQAYRLLSLDQRPVGDIARAVGIHDANYFSRVFRKRFGMSPSEVFQAFSPAPVPPATSGFRRP